MYVIDTKRFTDKIVGASKSKWLAGLFEQCKAQFTTCHRIGGGGSTIRLVGTQDGG